MRYTLYTSPLGENIRDPDDHAIKTLMTKGENYWQDAVGCGHGTFDLCDGKGRAKTLEITMRDDFGFYLKMTDRESRVHEHFYAVNQIQERKVVEFHYAGEPFFIPVQLLHSIKIASIVIKEFCASGTMAPCAVWLPRNDFTWDSMTGQFALN